jgi:uncharacterized membrane protein
MDTLNKMDTINNKRSIFKLAASILVISLLSACYYDHRDQVYPQVVVSNCDTTAVTYSSTVASILTANCNTCHATSVANSNGAGVILDNYTSVKTYINNGRLLNSILQNGQASAMPKNMAKLDACTINKITAWINKGALNN